MFKRPEIFFKRFLPQGWPINDSSSTVPQVCAASVFNYYSCVPATSDASMSELAPSFADVSALRELRCQLGYAESAGTRADLELLEEFPQSVGADNIFSYR